MSEIKWQKPPVRDGAGNKPSARWAAVAGALRERPGEWALVAEAVPVSTAGNIRYGRIIAFRDGGFETEAHKRLDGKGHDIYARFVGKGGEHK